jgi:hypothetical protein
VIAKMLETLKGANNVLAARGTAAGFDGAVTPTDGGNLEPYAALEKGLQAFAKANNITNPWTSPNGYAAFIQTDEGAALKRAYDESRRAG